MCIVDHFRIRGIYLFIDKKSLNIPVILDIILGAKEAIMKNFNSDFGIKCGEGQISARNTQNLQSNST